MKPQELDSKIIELNKEVQFLKGIINGINRVVSDGAITMGQIVYCDIQRYLRLYKKHRRNQYKQRRINQPLK